MADEPLVSPNDLGATAPEQPAPDENAAPEAQAATLPHEIVKMPTMMALIAGSPPALSARIGKGHDDNPSFDAIRKHKDSLQQAGFGFYKSLSGDLGVIFNSLYIHPEDILAADKAGKLQQIAPPADAIHHAISKAGLANPVLRLQNLPGGPAAQKSIAPPQTASGLLPVPSQSVSGPAAGIQNKAQNARLKSLAPSGPLTGPSPGAGRLLNKILSPVV